MAKSERLNWQRVQLFAQAHLAVAHDAERAGCEDRGEEEAQHGAADDIKRKMSPQADTGPTNNAGKSHQDVSGSPQERRRFEYGQRREPQRPISD